MKKKVFNKIKSIFREICLEICLIGITMGIGGNIIREIEKKNPELKKKWYSKTLDIMELIVTVGFWLIVLYILLTLIF